MNIEHVLKIKTGVKIAKLWLWNPKVMFWVPNEVAASPHSRVGQGRLTVSLQHGTQLWPMPLLSIRFWSHRSQPADVDKSYKKLPLPYLHRWGALGHGLVHRGESWHGRHEHIVAHQDVPLHQSLDQWGWGHCDVRGDLDSVGERKIRLRLQKETGMMWKIWALESHRPGFHFYLCSSLLCDPEQVTLPL